MNTVLRSDEFDAWLSKLRDLRARSRIQARIAMIRAGHFGDVKPVGRRLFELRIDVGPGYRVYYARRDSTVYLLLSGGDKSTQDRDIRAAIKMLSKENE